jgi:outer membrane cobalamin receptor
MASIFMKNGIFAVRAAALPAALLVLGSSLGVSAQTLGRPASLPDVVVTATRTPTSLEDTLAAVTVISAAGIAPSQASDLP